jgi:hypothetical protein
MIYSYAIVFGLVGILLIALAVFAISFPSGNAMKMKLFRIFSDKGLQLILTAVILGFNFSTDCTVVLLVVLHVIHTLYVIKYQKNI